MSQPSIISLASIIINDGLHDIINNTNRYGVARNLMKTILSYRSYTRVYHEIRAGFLPHSKVHYSTDRAFKNAIVGRRMDLIKYFSERMGNIMSREGVDKCVYTAARYGYTDLVDLCINKYFGHQKYAIEGYARINRMDLVAGHDAWYKNKYITRGAARGGHLEIVQKYFDDTSIRSEVLTHAARGGHLEIIKFLTTGNNEYINTSVMTGAARGGHFDIFKNYFVNIENVLELCLADTAKGGHEEIAKFILTKLQKPDYKRALEHAMKHQRNNMIEFFYKLIGYRYIPLMEKDSLLIIQ